MIYIWKEAPFVRILFPFLTGILAGWHCSIPMNLSFMALLLAGLCLLLLTQKDLKHRHFNGWMTGICFFILFFMTGAIAVNIRMIAHQPNWIGNKYRPGMPVEMIVEEPLVEKQNTYKALAKVVTLYTPKPVAANGWTWVYFKKKYGAPDIHYGTRLLIKQTLQPIRSSGNPGSFNYRQYAFFKGITHQVFAAPHQYLILDSSSGNRFTALLFRTQEMVLRIIRQYIKGEHEIAVAEALLIGYRNDLDRDLLQAYSNTGVVHVIAISGMHLGLLYLIMLFITKPLSGSTKGKWIRFFLITGFLWFFSFLTGGGASVLRAALMFTCMSGGTVLGKKSSVYNSLALSAFFLLLIHPFYLWDVGFQLSYAAVLSIVIFMDPISNCILCNNRLVHQIWQLIAVTIAAQILTLPLCMYHFHQIPNLFLFTNFIAVPLSSIVLFGELAVLILSWHHELAQYTGVVISCLLRWMNELILYMNQLPFAVTDGIRHNALQTIFIYLLILFFSIWIGYKINKMLLLTLICASIFLILKTIQQYQWMKQQTLIVYNIPGHRAVELIQGRNSIFMGDSALQNTKSLRNLYLQPAHVELGISKCQLQTNRLSCFYSLDNKGVVLLDHAVSPGAGMKKMKTEILILTGNPTLTIQELLKSFSVRFFVFDNTNAPGKIRKWKAECAQQKIPCTSTAEEGAFVMKW